jgi:hypothetical protein
MAARPFQFAAEPDRIQQMRGAFVHLQLAQRCQAPHRDHDIFLGGKILEEKVKLEDEPKEFIPFPRQRVINEVRNRLIFDRDPAAVRVIEQAQDVEQGALAAAGGADYRVHGASFQLQGDPAQGMNLRVFLSEKALNSFAAERNFGLHGF